ncbi:glutamate ABC transporter permease [Terrabacter tumescens]|uniref:Glutamate ABC transporter permease n=1 Tax=Terrabacter tumescens TaxID=60443 RepID=A0ABQ2HJ14_9MICO|nr:amino acid ABC transporter permease [Terrabacter tumescens]GGM81803.1 glutamate ABC transporter permease [Terrabacter tumescens]
MSSEIVLFDAPGPKARRRHAILTVVGVVVALALVWLVVRKMGEANQLEGYMWAPFVNDPEVWTQYLLPGLWGTAKAAALSVVFAGIFGIVFGMARLSSNRWISIPAGVVVEFFRSVPVLIMMVFAYFGYFATSDLVSAQTAPLAAVVLALTLYNGSVIAELVRSGVFSLPKGQSEAGLSIGLLPGQTLRSIQLPQALTAMLPALVGQLVVVLKDSALGVVITYPELLNAAKTLGSAYANTVPAYLVAALIFIAINYLLTRLARAVEGWLKRRGGSHRAAGAPDAEITDLEVGSGVGTGGGR